MVVQHEDSKTSTITVLDTEWRSEVRGKTLQMLMCDLLVACLLWLLVQFVIPMERGVVFVYTRNTKVKLSVPGMASPKTKTAKTPVC